METRQRRQASGLRWLSLPLIPAAFAVSILAATLPEGVSRGPLQTRPAGDVSLGPRGLTVTLPIGLVLTKTVGVDPAVCASTDSISVITGTTVVYCYQAHNTGPITVTQHDLIDSELGLLLKDFSFPLQPEAAVFLTVATPINAGVVNTGTWVARVGGPITSTLAITATDTATVEVGGIVLSKTVGTDPAVCAVTDMIVVPSGTTVTYCYTVTNPTAVTLNTHDLVDSELGAILTSFPFDLGPAASAFLTQSATINATTVNTATWTAAIVGGPSSSDDDTATVEVEVATPTNTATPTSTPTSTATPTNTPTSTVEVPSSQLYEVPALSRGGLLALVLLLAGAALVYLVGRR